MKRTDRTGIFPNLCVVGLGALGALVSLSPVHAATTDDSQTLYTLGQLISRTLEAFDLSDADLKHVQEGLEDGVLGRASRVDLATEAPRLHALQAARKERVLQREREAAQAAVAAISRDDAGERTPSGIVLQALREGHGPAPTPTDHVSVHYEGTLVDGTVFDSSRARGEPATFPVKGVIACWTEALQRMRVGARHRVVCPPELAYGDRGAPPAIRPGATLVFDIELLGIVR